jgi:hypothetical protein
LLRCCNCQRPTGDPAAPHSPACAQLNSPHRSQPTAPRGHQHPFWPTAPPMKVSIFQWAAAPPSPTRRGNLSGGDTQWGNLRKKESSKFVPS